MTNKINIEVSFLLEKNDHGGYCSGDECKYSAKYKSKTITIDELELDHLDNNYVEYLLKKEFDFVNTSGSGYCKSRKYNGLGAHECRITKIDYVILEYVQDDSEDHSNY